MLTGEVPASTILLHGKSMSGSEMPLEHLASPAAFQANDIIAVNRSADRHRGCSLSVEFGYRFTKSCESLMNSRDQDRQLVHPNLVAADICCDDLGREFCVERWRRRIVWQFGSPCRDRQNTMPGKNRDAEIGSPLVFIMPKEKDSTVEDERDRRSAANSGARDC
jgi:hypothetical protein